MSAHYTRVVSPAILTQHYHFFGVYVSGIGINVYAFSRLTRKQNTSEFGVITSPIIILILGTGDCGSEGSVEQPALVKGPCPDSKSGLLTPSFNKYLPSAYSLPGTPGP